MAFNLIEITDEGDRRNTAITPEDGSSEVTYQLNGTNENTPPTVEVLSQVFDYFAGGVSNLEPKVSTPTSGGGGKIVRVLPPVHPFRPELSAAGVTSMVGYGQHGTGTVPPIVGLEPVKGTGFANGEYAHWGSYRFRVKFVKRPYFLLPDQRIEVKSGLYYYPPDGSSPLLIYYADEFRRFCTITKSPLPDTVTATHGQMEFKTQSGADPGGTPPKQFLGSPYLSLQNSTVELTWHNVPFRYFSDFTIGGATYKSYLNRFVGTINQHPITMAGMSFDAGSLLYLGATPQSYIPTSPVRQRLLGALTVGLDQGLLCNAKLRFLHTARTGTDVPTTGHAVLTNLNHVAAGHNLQAEVATRRFHYVATAIVGAAESAKRPCFESFPFQLFATDPLLQQPAGPI